MQTQTILAIVFSALLIFSCRKDDESVENSMVIGEVKDDTSQVDTITPLEPSGVENGCLLSGSIDSAELLWNNAVDERGGNYVYQVRNAVFCCDVYTTEFKVESNIIVKSTYQT